jgi:small subunit ribosomal protein S20
MANTPQAKKRILRNAKRAEINGARVSRIRTFVKQVESALDAGNKDEAKAAIARVQPELARGVARGVLHKNTAARKLSRLTRRLTTLAYAPCQHRKSDPPVHSGGFFRVRWNGSGNPKDSPRIAGVLHLAYLGNILILLDIIGE